MLSRRQLLMASMLAGGAAWVGERAAEAQTAAPSPPAEVAAELPGARLQGSGRLRFLGLRVYDARLWVASATVGTDGATASLALALELEYARGLDGLKIAERSLSEMQRQGEIDPAVGQRWLAAMKQIFPDVQAGDRITGLNVPGMGARFFINGRLQGDVRDAEFARRFFGIWLSLQTSEPTLRQALLGKSP